MAEQQDESQEKTEEPTPKRLAKAREDGQIARSQEVTIAASVICVALYLSIFGASLVSDLAEIFAGNFVFDKLGVMEPQVASGRLASSMLDALVALIPLLTILVLVVLAFSGLVGGFNFSWKAIQPKASKLNPISGIKNKIFSMRSIVELVKALSKFALVAGVGALLILESIDSFGQISLMALEPGLRSGSTIIVMSFLVVSSMLILIASIDAPYQIFQQNKKMKMSLKEVKDERKETDGSPEVKQRIRQKQRELSNARMIDAIVDADVVITNPDHFAIALAYDPSSDDPPIVIAKGADLIAERIKEKASESGVPLFASPSLARALFFTTEVGSYVPEALFEAVAVVIAYIFNLNSVNRSGPNASAPQPQIPDDMLFDSDGNRTSIIDV